MSVPDFTDIAKPSDGRAVPAPPSRGSTSTTTKAKQAVFSLPAAPVPAFTDISKSANDILNKDFYHALAANLEVKLKAPNGVAFTTKGTSTHDSATSGSVEAKKLLSNGIYLQRLSLSYLTLSSPLDRAFLAYSMNPTSTIRPPVVTGLIYLKHAGMSITETFTTTNLLSTKVELDNTLAQGLKAEGINFFSTTNGFVGQKLNLTFKPDPRFHARAFFDYTSSGAVQAVVDAVTGHEGFLIGGEVGYDVQKAAVTRYSATLGYTMGSATAALQATNNMNLYTASYYQRVNSTTEVGVKTGFDVKSNTSIGMELASKHQLDPSSFVKGKINDRGILALAYNSKINSGLTFGIGASFDANKLNEGGHKVGTSFTFEG
ncbi:Mitochondrial porin [Coniosporium apollinis]|uniref:Mitochondrial porin n=2 Tax=Coniosporium TaxID=2810619 RepID=A0ABQ9NM81_9PEZI|nr:Mitochondrial porin [Cladosporium sp. JES 115]KAJ9661857.1 Mitochondrial porin [Coniosporium apollinis]